MKKGLLVVVGALGASLLFSGCFVMRTMTFTDDKVQAGKKTTAKISVAGNTEEVEKMLGGGGSSERPFFMMISAEGSKIAKGGKFDTKGVFDGPVRLVKNAGLLGIAEEACATATPVSATSSKRGITETVSAVTTRNPFVATNERKFMDVRLPILATKTFNADGFGIFMGTWADDGDGVAEDPEVSDDSYDCQPPYISLLKIKGASPPPPKR
jgi:hypothetical protein